MKENAPGSPLTLMCLAVLITVGQSAPAADTPEGTGSPSFQIAADHAYGIVPHAVRFEASLTGEPLDFRQHELQSWYEDTNGESTIDDDGTTLRLVGNAAKMIAVDYSVTPETVVEFDFRCDVQGEVHGIGFDNDADLDVASARRIFALHGTEGWGAANNTFRTYDRQSSGDGWQRFRIPIGRFYNGSFRYLVFMNDHDVANPTADSRFRNVAIFEAGRDREDTRIRWDFGVLGEPASGQNDWRPSFTYTRPGRYAVTASVTDASGRTFQSQTVVRVKQPPKVRRTLFVDDQAIDSMQGVERIVHRALKYPGNPVVVGDRPWDAYRPQVYGTVLHDPQRDVLRMWYLAIPSHGLSPEPEPVVGGFKRVGHTTLVGYAESKDGYEWDKPHLGLLDFNGSKQNGLVNMGRDNTEGVSIVHDPDAADPGRRYKAIFWEHKVEPKNAAGREQLAGDQRADGMWVSFSEDGLNWTDYARNPVNPHGSDTGQCVLFDPGLKKYVLYSRLNVGRRTSRCTSDDFIHWSKPELVFAADESDPPGTQVYGSGFCIYEGIYLGTPWMFYAGTDQRIDVQLIHSRDGIHWHRTAGRERILPNGPEGAWDSGIIFTASHPVVLRDRILIYYFGMQGDHFGHPERGWEESKKYYRGGIGVATLRRDGWVSLNLPLSGGHVVTKPVTIPGPIGDDTTPRLILNANAFTGDIKVTLLDEQDKPIPGFEESNNLHGDFLRTEVTWPHDRTLADLAGRKVKLRIHGRLAKLYSYWFE